MKKNKVFWLFGFLFLCFLIGYLGSISTRGSLDSWYSPLQKPSWNPPPWVFGPVWTFLYVLIAFSGWLLFFSKKSPAKSWALLFYFFQLAFNGLWSFLFFYLENPLLSLIDIVLLNIFVFATIVAAFKTSKKTAGFLLLPYLFWTFYALTLNAAIVYLN